MVQEFQIVTLKDSVKVDVDPKNIDIIFITKKFISIDLKNEIPELEMFKVDECEYKIAIDDLLHFSIV